MSTTTKLPHDHQTQLATLKALRDELRIQAHLGSIEAKEAWAAIEPRFEALISEAAQAGVITVRAVNAVFRELKQLVTTVQKERHILSEKRAAHP